MNERVIAKRHGLAGPRSVGGVGGHVGVPYATARVAERHGLAGPRSVGGVGGHLGAPHKKD
jgi:hypothetical protein